MNLQREEVGGETYEYVPLGKHIVRATGVCGGRPTFKYTRIEVAGALQRLAAGEQMADIVAGYRGRVPAAAMQEAIDLAVRHLLQYSPDFAAQPTVTEAVVA